MTTTIHGTETSVTPDLVLELRWSRQTRTVVHTVLGDAEPDVTMRPLGLRTGTLQCFIESRMQVRALEDLLATGEVLSITSDDDELLDQLAFVVAGGEVISELDPQTLTRTIVTVPYQEVTP